MRILVLALLLPFLACSTAMHDEAEFLLEKEAFEEAALTYQKILEKEPLDKSAQAGLQKAREGHIAYLLADVEELLSLEKPELAQKALLSLVEREKAWKFRPSGDLSNRHTEVEKRILVYVKAEVDHSVEENFPLKAIDALNEVDPIFRNTASTPHRKEYRQLRSQVRRLGKTKCLKFRNQILWNKPYYGEFVSNYCQFWKTHAKVPLYKSSRLRELYKGLEFEFNVTELSDDEKNLFKQTLIKHFQESAWYSPDAKKVLPVLVQGRVKKSETTQKIELTHEYEVSIPYTAYQEVTRKRQVPYEAIENRYDPDTKSERAVKVTLYKTEEYQDFIPVTKYRAETRQYNYPATQRHSSLEVALLGRALFSDEEKAETWLSQKLDFTSTSHEKHLPGIGLVRKPPEKAPLATWMTEQADVFGGRLSRKAERFWSKKYCKTPEDESLVKEGEQAFRCLKSRPENPPYFVRKWYREQLGLSVAKANEILGVKKN